MKGVLRVGSKLTVTFKKDIPTLAIDSVLRNIGYSSFKGIKDHNLKWINYNHLRIFKYVNDDLIYNFYIYENYHQNFENLMIQTKNIIQASVDDLSQSISGNIDRFQVHLEIERSIVSYRLDE